MNIVVHLNHGPSGDRYLRTALPDAHINYVAEEDDRAFTTALRDAAVAITDVLSPHHTDQAEMLSLVQLPGAGSDGVAPDALPRECRLCNVYEHERAIAEWIIAAIIAMLRDVLVYDRGLRCGRWPRGSFWEGRPAPALSDLTMGLVGFGRIGVTAARLAHAMGMRTCAVTRHPTQDRQQGVSWLGGFAELPRLMKESDVVVVCLPLTDETRDFIDKPELALLGPDGYLVNVGRGPVVNEHALYRALADGRLAGAAIDVWYSYPSNSEESHQPSNFPFAQLQNVILSPHVSGWTTAKLEGRWKFIADQCLRVRDGKPLHNLLRVG